jgi:hypothetical protein
MIQSTTVAPPRTNTSAVPSPLKSPDDLPTNGRVSDHVPGLVLTILHDPINRSLGLFNVVLQYLRATCCPQTPNRIDVELVVKRFNHLVHLRTCRFLISRCVQRERPSRASANWKPRHLVAYCLNDEWWHIVLIDVSKYPDDVEVPPLQVRQVRRQARRCAAEPERASRPSSETEIRSG